MNKIKYIILSALCMLATVSISAKEEEIKSFSSGTLVLDKAEYVLCANLSHDMNDYDRSIYHGAAIKVKEGCTVKLNLNGYKMTLTGQNAKYGYEATPAIEIPESSTLVITGWGGTLVLRGGDGLQAENGGETQNPDYHCHSWWRGGWGGAGGRGGYGSAPAIGTWAGKGGEGGARSDNPANFQSDQQKYYNSAHSGGSGTSTKSMGKIFILGNIELVVNKGGVDKSFTNHSTPASSNSRDRHTIWSCRPNWACSAGGGGGQGGATIFAKYSIGAGAPGAGGGGAGGNGCVVKDWDIDDNVFHPGFGGKGGHSSTTYGSDGGTSDGSLDVWGEGAGSGGDYGSTGSHGSMYYTLLMNISSSSSGDMFSPNNSKRLNDEKDPFSYLPDNVKGKMTGAKFSNGKDNYPFYNGMNIDANLTVEIPAAPAPNAEFKGYWNADGDRIFDEKGKLGIVPGAHGKFKKDTYNVWYFATAMTEMPLIAHWSDRITVIENHYVENPEKTGDERFGGSPYYTDTWTTLVAEGTETTVVSRKFRNHDGSRINELLTEDEEKAAVAARRFRIAEGEKDSVSVTLSKDSVVVITHKYDRNEFDYALNYSGVLTDAEFKSLLVNADAYTQPGKQKYGRAIVRPRLNSLRGKYIKDWNPTDAYEIPVGGITMTPVEIDTVYYIKQDVKQGETECYIEVSKVDKVQYQQQITVKAHIVGQTCISGYLFTTIHKGDTIDAIQLNDSTFQFAMPDDDVNISMSFAKVHYNLIASLSNNAATKIALKSPLNSKLYTNDNDYFQFPDSLFGGELKDYKVYQNMHMNIIAEIDMSQFPDSLGMEFRPIVQVHCGNRDTNEEGHIKSGYMSGRMRKYYDYRLENAYDTDVKVLWAERISKAIRFSNPITARVNRIFTDVMTDVYDDQHDGATACKDDIVYFTVDTQAEDFNKDNIRVTYVDAAGKQHMEIVDVVTNEGNGEKYYSFVMPGHDVNIILNTGKKVNITNGLPDDGNEDVDEYTLLANKQAVVGTETSYFILSESFKEIKHAIALCNNGKDEVSESMYSPTSRICFGEQIDLAYGTFIVPESDVTICNGFMLRPDMKGNWFGLYADEDIPLPEYITAYDLASNGNDEFELHELERDIVPANHPVICCMDFGMFTTSADTEDFHFFLGSTPYTNAFSDMIPMISGNTEQTTVKKLQEKHGNECDIFVLDYDEEKSQVFFRIGNEAEVIKANSIYLVMDGPKEPIYPVTGIMDVQSNNIPSAGISYNMMGVPVTGSYKGIVIRDGKKYLKK